MRVRSQLVMTLNLIVSICASFFASQLFFSSKISNEAIKEIFEHIQALEFYTHVSFISEVSLKTALFVFILGFTLFNLLQGKSDYIKNIYYLCILLILPEVFAHSKFEWVDIFWGVDVYTPSRSFIETLFICLIIIGGYLFLYLDSHYRGINSTIQKRGVPVEEIDVVYSNQSIVSLSLVVFSFFVVVMLSFMVQTIIDPLHQFMSLNNLNYVLFGVISSTLLASTLYVSLREQVK